MKKNIYLLINILFYINTIYCHRNYFFDFFLNSCFQVAKIVYFQSKDFIHLKKILQLCRKIKRVNLSYDLEIMIKSRIKKLEEDIYFFIKNYPAMFDNHYDEKILKMKKNFYLIAMDIQKISNDNIRNKLYFQLKSIIVFCNKISFINNLRF